MRFNFPTDARPRRSAKKLKGSAKALGIEIKLTKAQHAIARVYGYRNWMVLLSSLGTTEPSAWDENVANDEIIRRKEFQVKGLAATLGVEEMIADALISIVRPTGGSVPHVLSDDLCQEEAAVTMDNPNKARSEHSTFRSYHLATPERAAADASANNSSAYAGSNRSVERERFGHGRKSCLKHSICDRPRDCRLSKFEGNGDGPTDKSSDLRAVSGGNQKSPGSGVTAQEAKLREQCLQQGWQVAGCYRDPEISGRGEVGPALTELLRHTRRSLAACCARRGSRGHRLI